MVIDQTTYNDLSVFHAEEEFSVFHKLNFTQTTEGRDWLYNYFSHPFNDRKQILETQAILKLIIRERQHWPMSISNGTLMVIEKFYESNIDPMPQGANPVNGLFYKIFHGPDYSLTRYSLTHFADFFRGLKQLIRHLDQEDAPLLFRSLLQRARDLMNRTIIQELIERDPLKPLSLTETLHYGAYVKDHFKAQSLELIRIFGRMDAWQSMAAAVEHFRMSFPEMKEVDYPLIDAHQLYHILLPQPVPYDVHMNRESNFIFLTGANMAGKSTFIKAVGCAVFLAHLGMGVPAEKMELSVFDGLLSNINVVDNIIKGESYFFNEVQRIRNTIIKINDGRKWLVLIDELFKGTNVQDAMKCSSTVIKGLIKIQTSLFILSTHLYEIGEELKAYPNISFRYFETAVEEDQLSFSYQLREGISNDRLGYLILKREKVVELLESL